MIILNYKRRFAVEVNDGVAEFVKIFVVYSVGKHREHTAALAQQRSIFLARKQPPKQLRLGRGRGGGFLLGLLRLVGLHIRLGHQLAAGDLRRGSYAAEL